jgi:glycosyltransferase involved in cell wall biosynthesis
VRRALLGADSLRPALVCSVHGFATPFYPLPRRLLQGGAMRWVAARSAAVVACCETERTALLTARAAPPARIRVVPYGIDLAPLMALGADERAAARSSIGADESDWITTMVCRIDRPRDFESLIEAFGRVAGAIPGARLWIVGDGPHRDSVEARIRAAGLESRIRLWGFRRDVTSFYAATDACVLTSWGWEGLPLSVIEAQAAARPVVVTDAGGSRESIEPETTGILVPTRDPTALAEALARLAADPAAARQMGWRGRQRARKRFGIEKMVTRLESLYAELGHG